MTMLAEVLVTAPEIIGTSTLDRKPSPQPTSAPQPVDVADTVATWGASSVSPFLLGPGREALSLSLGGVTGFVRQGGWAVMATDPVAPSGLMGVAIDDTLEALHRRRLRPVFAAVVDDAPYRQRGLFATAVAEDSVIDLSTFSLEGKRRTKVRHSVSAAHRQGLRVEPLTPGRWASAQRMSQAWLRAKRGPEMGFTLGRLCEAQARDVDARVAVDADGNVVGLVTWRRYRGGEGRVLDLMRRAPDAPNPTMDFLIADGLASFAAGGIGEASLGSVPLSHGRLAERIYPTRSLRAYKEKFAPDWQPRFVVTPSRLTHPGGLLAICRAYCGGQLLGAVRRHD
jgi:phosphatidylglycerol lysyltransferase